MSKVSVKKCGCFLIWGKEAINLPSGNNIATRERQREGPLYKMWRKSRSKVELRHSKQFFGYRLGNKFGTEVVKLNTINDLFTYL